MNLYVISNDNNKYIQRAEKNDRIRIISARLATKKERQDYEQHTGF